MLLILVLLATASLACSGGGALTGSGGPTPTKTRRATFTPLPGALTTSEASGPVVRGTLPPGVTVAVGGEQGVKVSTGGPGTPAVSGGGNTSLLIFATDTPTPSPVPTDRPPTSTPVEMIFEERPTAQSTPFVVVQPATLNGRRGPGTEYERVGEASQGDELFILGRSAEGGWLLVCCMANQPVWVSAEQVKTQGAVETTAILTPPPVPLPTPTRRPVVVSPGTGQSPLATPRPVGTPLPPFDIARGPEFPIRRDNGLLTIWVKIYSGPLDNQTPLGGYTLHVTRDGVDVSDNQLSFDDRPFDNTGPRQGSYDYNLKFEMYEAGEADWEIFLARPGGFRVSPITKFTTKGDSYRNLVVYIAYVLAR
jgi:hypothetical protein